MMWIRTFGFLAVILGFSPLSAFAVSEIAPPDFTPSITTGENGDPVEIYYDAATDAQIAAAKCKTKSAPITEEMLGYIQSRARRAPIEEQSEVSNLVFEHESKVLLGAFRDLTENAAVKDPNDPLHECKKVWCAVQKIWGKRLGAQILYLKVRFGFNVSEYPYVNATRFHEDELDDVIIAAMDLPSRFIPFAKNQQLSRFLRGTTLAVYGENSRVAANAVINLFDLWEGDTHPRRQSTVFHEISHNIGYIGDLESSETWKKVSGWREGGKSLCKVSEYGDTKPSEDFAETLVMYRYRPEALKQICKSKYNFIRDQVFGGVEFTSIAACTAVPQKNIDQAVKAISARFLDPNFDWAGINDREQLFAVVTKSPELKQFKDERARTEIVAQTMTQLNEHPIVQEQFRRIEAAARDADLRAKQQEEFRKFMSSAQIHLELQQQYRIFIQDGFKLDADQAAVNLLFYQAATPEEVQSFFESSIVDSMIKGLPARSCLYNELGDDKKAAYRKLALQEAASFRDLLNPAIASLRDTFSFQLSDAVFKAKMSLRRLSDREYRRATKSSPEEFCAQWYAGLSALLPPMKDWCIAEQSKTKKRFELNESTEPFQSIYQRIRGR